MNFKFIALFILYFSSPLFSLPENEPRVEFIKCAYESIKDYPCKNFAHLTEGPVKHPVNILRLNNFPLGQKITLFIKRPLLGKGNQKLYDFILNKTTQGTAVVPTSNYLPGERVDVIFRSEDRKFNLQANFIPNPIRVKNKEGKIILTAELVMTSANLDTFQIDLFDIPENERLLFKSVSDAEVIEYPMRYSKDNPIMISPGTAVKKGGVSQVYFTRESGEIITLNLPWGKELYKYSKGNDIFDPED